MNNAKSPKKTMASWVADLEQGIAALRPDDAGRFGANARASPAKSKTHPPRRPPPFHTFPDTAPQPVPPRLGGNKSPEKRPRGVGGDAEGATVEHGAGSGGGVAFGSRSDVSDATREKRATRAAAKIRTARGESRDARSAFDEMRHLATATRVSVGKQSFRARRDETGVARRARSAAGAAEETAARSKPASRARMTSQAQMTAKQLGEALDAANARIGDLSARLRSAEEEASEVSAARAAREKAAAALERADKAESASARHKEAVAKLTADNMVFLMRLKESETELRDARAQADSMREELEESRGAWFDKARRDVERVVQNAMRRAESADAALEAEIAAGDERARKWAEENARLRAVAAQNESLAETTARAAAALDEAAEAGRLNELALRDSRRREFDALNAQKAATAAMTAAREEMGVLKQRMVAMAAALEDQKRVSESLVEKAKTSAAALATQQRINAGVMQLKNDAEWRVLEMSAAFERAGLEAPSRIHDWTGGGDVPQPSAPRLAGRPGPAVSLHSALSPLPAPNDLGLGTPTPLSPETLAQATEQAVRAAGVPARAPAAESVEAALSEYAREFAFGAPEKQGSEPEAVSKPDRLPAKRSPAKRSPAKRSPAKRSHAKASVPAAPRAASPPACRARASLSTTGAPLVPNSRHGNVYGATATAASLAHRETGENRSPSPRAKKTDPGGVGPGSPAGSPRRVVVDPKAASPSKSDVSLGPAWGTSPAKGKPREDRAAAVAVADARRASAEWSRAQARSYSSRKELRCDVKFRDAPSSPSRDADAAAYAPLPSASPRSRSSMASAASNARRRIDADSVPAALPAEAASERSVDDDDDAEDDAVVPEEVFLRAAALAGDGGFEGGWIGGRPSLDPPHRRIAGVSTGDATRASAATVSDSDDGDAPERKKKKTFVAEGARPSSEEEAEAEFDFGVVAGHEAAMARLLGPSRSAGGVADYGATRRVSPRRRTGARAVEDADANDAADARGGGVSFSNALPRVR